MATTREELRDLIDRLPESALERAAQYLAQLSKGRQSFEEFLASVPDDDEPLTDEDRQAITEGEEAIATGRGIRREDLPPIAKSPRGPQRRRPVA